MRFKLPFAIFMLLALALGFGLTRDPRKLPSALIDRPAPAISRPLLHTPGQTLELDSLRGQVWLLNVWASWCAPCIEELPVLTTHAARDGVPIYGLNYKDKDDAARRLLQRYGNPYRASAVDADGRTGMDWGVYGVPETFIIDRAGRVRFKHAGPITEQIWRETVMPIVRSLE